ncbi:MAG: Exodeoxyribonuclease 7 small subunit [Chloroflexi bacterium ADurb.Bin180]|jgi:exodeoxyribonuclease VII small subunit|nr:MAG: Exodeoxyribonuclease 7 small subunit [Chloroflexi bacterium ADurb.Bin180]HNR95384.1 exodeoxyribonuclease VII small subunit [Anaerolineae bacterium]HNT04695.1 exodeoxyribonuclease VII small subunit [Anaerolineae bacterium]
MADKTAPSFEESFAQLEEVVRQLERGELTLDESMALFEKGIKLAQLCEAKLDKAEQKVSQLVGIGSDSITLATFEEKD